MAANGPWLSAFLPAGRAAEYAAIFEAEGASGVADLAGPGQAAYPGDDVV